MLRYTILGATGFVGRHLVDYLRKGGFEVATPPRGASPIESGFLGRLIYAIGLTGDFYTRPFDTMEAHVSVLSDWLRNGDFASFLYLSSTRVYARASEAVEDQPLPVLATDPSDLYNISKLAGEALCRSSGRQGVRVARLSNVVGPNEGGKDTFLGELCRDARAGALEVRTAPKSAKDYVWIDDVTRLIHLVSTSGQSDVYNVASGRQISHLEWCGAISDATGCSFSFRSGAPQVDFPPISIARVSREFRFESTSPLDRVRAMLGDATVGIAEIR